MFAIALSGYFEEPLKVNLCAVDIVSTRAGYSIMSASKLHRRITPPPRRQTSLSR